MIESRGNAVGVEARLAAAYDCPGNSVIEILNAAEFDLTTDLRHFNWSGLVFDHSNLAGCDFTGARLDGCSFNGCRIEGAIFDDEIIASGVLQTARDFDTYQRPQRNSVFFSQAFFAMKTPGQMRRFLAKHALSDIVRTTEHVNHYLHRFGTFEDAVQALSLFTELRLSPDVATFDWIGHLAEMAGRENNAHAKIQQTIELSKSWQVRSSAGLFARLIGTARTFDEAREILREYSRRAATLDARAHARLIELAPDFQTALKLFKNMVYQVKIAPTEEVYCAMILKANSMKNARRNFEAIQANGLTYSTRTLNTYLGNFADPKGPKDSRSYVAARKTIKRLNRVGVEPDSGTYEQLMRLATNFQTVQSVLWEIRELRIRPTAPTTGYAARRIRSRAHATKLRSILARKINLPQVFFEEVYRKLAPKMDAAALLNWAFSNSGNSDRPRDSAWGVAISYYHKEGNFPQAMRIAYAFPFLDASRALFAAYPDDSVWWLQNLYNEGKEPHLTAHALGKICEERGQFKAALEWYRRAIAAGGLTQAKENRIRARIEEITSPHFAFQKNAT